MRVAFVSVVPSPYQRDFFAALAARGDVDLRIYYLEDSAPDSPWPPAPLRDYERILPGFWLGRGPVRTHINRIPEELAGFDLVVLNTIVSVTAQRLVRGLLRQRKWIFWGERLRRQSTPARTWIQRQLVAPLARARAIAAIGERAKDDYQRRFPRQTVHNIPYHTSLKAFEVASAPRPSRFTFFFCGQMIARKGLDILLEAFQQVARHQPGVHLLLVGRSAEEPPLLARLAPDVRARVEMAGFQPPDGLAPWFRRADVFVLPSRHDGWGVVVNQALGAGLPLICTDAVGAAHDLLQPEVNGLMIPAGNVSTLAEAMQRLAEDPDLARKWGHASRSMAADWTPEAGAAKWHRLLEETLAS